MSLLNLSKSVVTELDAAPVPEPGVVLQVRTGKVKALGPFQSAIAKQEHEHPVFASETGFLGDEHNYKFHGDIDRAINQYVLDYYADWRKENPPHPALFQPGGFGENLSTTSLDEENVCIGDLYRVGRDVLLQVSEPRNPCYKLNIRFDWPTTLKRVQRTGRTGWNYRVLQTGYIGRGDAISLVDRPHPRWSVRNVQRILAAKSVPPPLLEECSELTVMTSQYRDRVQRSLANAPKVYTLVEAKTVTPRVRELTFALKDVLKRDSPTFEPYAYAQIHFGPQYSFSRPYSIIAGTLLRFSLGVALDENSRGGSRYLHQQIKIGDEIKMLPCSNPQAWENEKKCSEEKLPMQRIFIVGGIGITAFLSAIGECIRTATPFTVHYAVRSPEEAAYQNLLPPDKTFIYATPQNQRLDLSTIIPPPTQEGTYTTTRILCCGPPRLMDVCRLRTTALHYPPHLLHFEDFSVAPQASNNTKLGEAFDVDVTEAETQREESLHVPSHQTLLQVLTDAGFDVMSSCQTGACGACKVTVRSGTVCYRSKIIVAEERDRALQSCVDRGLGRIQIEID